MPLSEVECKVISGQQLCSNHFCLSVDHDCISVFLDFLVVQIFYNVSVFVKILGFFHEFQPNHEQ